MSTRTGEEYEQPGDMMLLCGYGLMNVRMMLLSRHRQAL